MAQSEAVLICSVVAVFLLAVAWFHQFTIRRRALADLAACTLARSDLTMRLAETESNLTAARRDLERARPYLAIPDIEAEVERIRQEAARQLSLSQQEARDIVQHARGEADALIAAGNQTAASLVLDARRQAEERLAHSSAEAESAIDRARHIVKEAEQRAEAIAGEAYQALKDSKRIEQVADAMRNKIEGYGDRYVVPSYSVLDELAETYGFAEAGRELKAARERSSALIRQGRAAECDYVEWNRRQTAIRFVLDAFNGKVDSALSGIREGNVGTLKQRILDAFALVNFNGQAFRRARITDEYLAARLEELKWAAAAVALRERDREEQRAIKARIREEERAQREFERAKREAERDEAAARKAMAKMEEMLARATEEQKQQYQEQLQELTLRLAAAEAKGQRALSMAQQTKSGHVYIISNIGSFGEHVYKIGMTRRLEPFDRIRELGDASVPFAFDVHVLLYADDAPAVERMLHRKFLIHQINKVNPRKEFFRVSLIDLKEEMQATGLQCAWTLAAEAADYKETLAINARIATDPEARAAWLHRQAVVDPVTEGADDEARSALIAEHSTEHAHLEEVP